MQHVHRETDEQAHTTILFSLSYIDVDLLADRNDTYWYTVKCKKTKVQK